MGTPSSAQLAALRMLFGSVPDATLRMLEKALIDSGPAMAAVRDMVREEFADRRLRELAFAPISPLFSPREFGPSFPARLAAGLWTALRTHAPNMVAQAADETRYLRADETPPKILDELCLEAAVLLRQRRGPPMRGDEAQVADDLAAYFELAPLARQSLARLPDWLGRVSEDRTAALKIILRDASAAMADGAPRLLEIFLAHLPESQLVLRIISVASDRASDRYLAVSELAMFGDRLLDEVERRVERIGAFDPTGPAGEARSFGEDATRACAVLAEFERSIEIARDGPWGRRITAAHRRLAANVEARLRDVEPALARALPTRKVRTHGRMTRPAPCLDREPDARAVAQAQALFAFFEATRAAAQVGGYGALRTQVGDKLRERITEYVDETVHEMSTPGEVSPERGLAFLELAAQFLEKADDPKGAQLVRRRAAALEAAASTQRVA